MTGLTLTAESPVLVLAHGLEGSPDGTKVQALRVAGVPVDAPDGRGLVLADRLPGIRTALDRHRDRAEGERLVLAGSSYGGLAVAWLAQQLGPRLDGLLLLAPALHHKEAPVGDPAMLLAPEGVPTVVIHGLRDDVVPIGVSRTYAVASHAAGRQVSLLEVDDDHRLAASLDQVITQARLLLGLPLS